MLPWLLWFLIGFTAALGAPYSVRAMCVHLDKVTGVDRLFLTIGTLGIFSGVYDESVPGKVKWSPNSECGSVETRPLAIVEANGDLLFSAGRKIYRQRFLSRD